MIKGATARRYAGAVFELGLESHQVDSWRTDLETLASYFGNKRLQFILREPKIPLTRKQQVVRDLLADKLRPEALNLAFLLVERDLVDHAPAIFSEFDKQYNNYKGQAIAQVTTAIPLDPELREQVRGQLARPLGEASVGVVLELAAFGIDEPEEGLVRLLRFPHPQVVNKRLHERSHSPFQVVGRS